MIIVIMIMMMIIIIVNSTYKWFNILKNVKLSNTQLKKLKDTVRNNTRTILRINSKMFDDGNNLPHELLLTTRQKKKVKKCF